MQLKTLFQPDANADERGVSPVIGVILMVAITVILAAVIGTFVLGLGEDVNSTPQATWDFEIDEGSNELIITHGGGDSIEASQLGVTSSDNTVDISDLSTGGEEQFSDPVTAGNSATVSIADASGETVRLVYTAEGGGSSNVIATFDIPSDADISS